MNHISEGNYIDDDDDDEEEAVPTTVTVTTRRGRTIQKPHKEVTSVFAGTAYQRSNDPTSQRLKLQYTKQSTAQPSKTY